MPIGPRASADASLLLRYIALRCIAWETQHSVQKRIKLCAEAIEHDHLACKIKIGTMQAVRIGTEFCIEACALQTAFYADNDQHAYICDHICEIREAVS